MVWARAEGRCEGMVGYGARRQRCEARVHLQFDHIRPIAAGGGGETENLQLFCSACNQRKLNRENIFPKDGVDFYSASLMDRRIRYY